MRRLTRLFPVWGGGALPGPIAEWLLGETSGTNIDETANQGASDGTADNVTLNNDTFDGIGTPLFVGASLSRIYFPANAVPKFNGALGSIEVYAKVAAAEWTSGSTRHLLKFGVDASNYVGIDRPGSYVVEVFYVAGGTVKGSTRYMGVTDYIHIHMTWDKAANACKVYIGGLLWGTTTGLGTWAGTLTALYTVIGANLNSGYQAWQGNISRVRLWDRVLSAGEIKARTIIEFPSANGLLCLGDSKTYNDPWPHLLADALTTATSTKYVAREDIAVGGYSVTELLAYVPGQLALRNDSVSTICINIGANDIPAPTSQAQFETNLTALIDLLLVKYPTAEIYVAKIWRRSYPANVITINGYIDTVVASYSGVSVHLGHDESVWMEGGDDGVTYTSDGVHPKLDSTVQPYVVTQWLTAMGY